MNNYLKLTTISNAQFLMTASIKYCTPSHLRTDTAGQIGFNAVICCCVMKNNLPAIEKWFENFHVPLKLGVIITSRARIVSMLDAICIVIDDVSS